MKNILKASAAVCFLSLIVVGFQNCSGKDFTVSQEKANSSGPTGLSADSSFDSGVESNGDLVQIQGNFNSDGGSVNIDGNISVVNIQALDNNGNPMPNGANGSEGSHIVINGVPSNSESEETNGQVPEGRFRICAKLNQPGDQQLQLTQGLSDIIQLLIPAFTTEISVQDMIFGFVTMVPVTSSSGEITINCVPGSTITSQIYGADQLGSGMTCTSSGTLTFNVTLVPSFVNTGNRVVVVTQTLENGSVTTISMDIDNTAPAHQCSISGGSANTDICVDSAGTVTGNCKAGLPVKLFVDDQLQEVVTCKANGQFEVNNVLLPSGSDDHEIRIEQDSPFTVKCSDSVVIENMGQLNN
jgi:hypothetical protein